MIDKQMEAVALVYALKDATTQFGAPYTASLRDLGEAVEPFIGQITAFHYEGTTPSDTKGTLTFDAPESAPMPAGGLAIARPADKYTRAGLRAERAAIIESIIFAQVWERPWESALWAALAVIDAECVAAGLPTSLTETGALR